MAEQIKVAVLEERLQNFESVVSKLDAAIEKIAEVNNNVSRMLAVHEERISKQEEIDSILFDKIDKLRDKMDSDHDSVTKRLSLLERKLWVGLGVLGTIVAISNPNAIRMLRPLISSSGSAIMAPAIAFVNGSR
jgi:biopolymer transport protein ExbB/TolQ